MRRRFSPDYGLLAASGTLAAIVGLWAFALFSVVAKAHAVAVGAAPAQERLDRIDAALRGPGDPNRYRRGALCAVAPAEAAESLQRRLRNAAAGYGLAVTAVSASPGEYDAGAGGLTPVNLEFDVQGSYEGVIGLLRSMANSTPQIFVSTAELRTKISAVDLQFSGRIYCSTFAIR